MPLEWATASELVSVFRPESLFSTGMVVVAIWVSEPGNPTGKFVVVCRRTVTGWVPPAPVAESGY